MNNSPRRSNKPAAARAGFSVAELFIALVALAVLGSIGWYALNVGRFTSPGPNTGRSDPTTVSDPQLNKLYKNDEYGFSFRYPSFWKVTESLQDNGRGHAEGEVMATAPDGVVLSFSPNLGGKGGDCTPDPGDTPHHSARCPTLEVLSLQRITAAGDPNDSLYFYHAAYTPAGAQAVTQYGSFIENGVGAPTAVGPIIGAVTSYGIVHTKIGYVDVSIRGAENTSSSYFDNPRIKQAEAIMRSFRLAQ